MNQGKKTYRKANGRRVEGLGLAIRVAQEVKGLLLAHAFVIAKSAGYKFRVNKMDGVRVGPEKGDETKETITVDVVNGVVTKSWADTAKVHS